MRRVHILVFALVWAQLMLAMAGPVSIYERGRARYFSSRSIKSPIQKRNAYLRAAGELKQFLGLYPKHADVPAALYNVASIYRELAEETGDRDDAGRALHYYREILRLAPKDPLADDALAGVAEVCSKIFKDDRCRKEAEERIRREYSSGDMIARLPETISEGMMVAPMATSRVEVMGTNVAEGTNETVLRVQLNQSTPFLSKYLAADSAKNVPARFFIDLQNAHLNRGTRAAALSTPPSSSVSGIRVAQNTLETVRVVLDLAPGISNSQVSAAIEGTGVVIRVSGGAAAEPAPSPPVSTVKEETETTLEKKYSVPPKKVFRIVVDAGHGGDDTGARGPKGTFEKDITLAVAKKVESLLWSRGLYEVFMTRVEDRTMTLSERTNYANRSGGDLFVSIHCNASPKHSAEGVSTYFLDNADDAESLRVAMRENGELTAPAVPDRATSEEYYLEIMKASMEKNFHTVQSTDLARTVQTSLMENLRQVHKDVEDLGMKSARFYVLTGAKMPAILVETSFISNPKEEKRLRDEQYQEKLANAILRGIDKYFKNAAQEHSHSALYRN